MSADDRAARFLASLHESITAATPIRLCGISVGELVSAIRAAGLVVSNDPDGGLVLHPAGHAGDSDEPSPLIRLAAAAATIARFSSAARRGPRDVYVPIPWAALESIRETCDEAGIDWRRGIASPPDSSSTR